jgi:hypothetical protein
LKPNPAIQRAALSVPIEEVLPMEEEDDEDEDEGGMQSASTACNARKQGYQTIIDMDTLRDIGPVWFRSKPILFQGKLCFRRQFTRQNNHHSTAAHCSLYPIPKRQTHGFNRNHLNPCKRAGIVTHDANLLILTPLPFK